ncbi:MAG: hypothetical protein IPK07_23435 [Deltaproteobacteria bacterium]|nr:hypothetical protein [Deltaproteobacteria bacterium]
MKRFVFAPAACALALLLTLWASIDVAAFHVRRGIDRSPRTGGGTSAALSAHEPTHVCAFAAVANAAHMAPLAVEDAPLVRAERAALALASPRPIPGRTASGLAPPA